MVKLDPRRILNQFSVPHDVLTSMPRYSPSFLELCLDGSYLILGFAFCLDRDQLRIRHFLNDKFFLLIQCASITQQMKQRMRGIFSSYSGQHSIMIGRVMAHHVHEETGGHIVSAPAIRQNVIAYKLHPFVF